MPIITRCKPKTILINGEFKEDPDCPLIILGEVKLLDRSRHVEPVFSKTQEFWFVGILVFIIIAVCACTIRRNILKRRVRKRLKNKFYY